MDQSPWKCQPGDQLLSGNVAQPVPGWRAALSKKPDVQQAGLTAAATQVKPDWGSLRPWGGGSVRVLLVIDHHGGFGGKGFLF